MSAWPTRTTNFNAADFGVFIVCELFAVPLCLAGWEAIVGGEHLFRGIVALAFGVPIGLIGAGFHWWKDKLPSARDWLLRQADRWWPVAAFLAFAYVAGPAMYQRAFPVTETPRSLGRVTWDFEQSARGFSYFLNMIKVPNQEIRVLGFQAHGKNNSPDPISQIRGNLHSDLTNVPHPIYILAQDLDETKIAACIPKIPTLPDETFGIPAFADFDIATYEKLFAEIGKDGVPASKFLSDYAPFTVALEYDGATYSRHFTRTEVVKQIEIFEKSLNLESIPRVVRKVDAPKPIMAPLHLPQATPIPQKPAPENSPTGSVAPKD